MVTCRATVKQLLWWSDHINALCLSMVKQTHQCPILKIEIDGWKIHIMKVETLYYIKVQKSSLNFWENKDSEQLHIHFTAQITSPVWLVELCHTLMVDYKVVFLSIKVQMDLTNLANNVWVNDVALLAGVLVGLPSLVDGNMEQGFIKAR